MYLALWLKGANQFMNRCLFIKWSSLWWVHNIHVSLCTLLSLQSKNIFPRTGFHFSLTPAWKYAWSKGQPWSYYKSIGLSALLLTRHGMFSLEENSSLWILAISCACFHCRLILWKDCCRLLMLWDVLLCVHVSQIQSLIDKRGDTLSSPKGEVCISDSTDEVTNHEVVCMGVPYVSVTMKCC